MKICYIASSGGHLEQVLRLKKMLDDRCESFVVTEKTPFALSSQLSCYYLHQVNRREFLCIPKMVGNAFRSVYILFRERPDAVISTGALAVIPLCLLGKLLGKKLIFMESFAVMDKPTQTGKLLYRYADRFYIQRESLQKYYPEAVYLGGIY